MENVELKEVPVYWFLIFSRPKTALLTESLLEIDHSRNYQWDKRLSLQISRKAIDLMVAVRNSDSFLISTYSILRSLIYLLSLAVYQAFAIYELKGPEP